VKSLLAYLAFALIALQINLPSLQSEAPGKGLYILVTFPNLAEDLKQLACSGDTVDYIAPPGLDPHEYQLTPSDVEKLLRADLVVSTSHAPFEIRIRELREQGLLKAVLVEIPWIPGIVLKNNPVLNTPNLHTPVYDPENYVVFINNITSILSTLNPECSSFYASRARIVVERVQSIAAATPKLSLDAVADTPVIQYAVEWLGIRVKYLVAREHESEASPQDLAVIEKAIANREVGVVAVTSPVTSRAGMWLVERAERYGIPVIYVPSPIAQKSVVEKLEEVAVQVRGFATTTLGSASATPAGERGGFWSRVLEYAAIAVAVAVLVLTAYAVVRKR